MLTDLQLDALTEIFNVGMGAAGASLSEMVDEPVNLSVPVIYFMSRADAAERLAENSSNHICGVSQLFNGFVSGTTMLLFPVEKSLELVRLLLKDTVPLDRLTEFEEEAFNEIGNIILNAGIASLANLFEKEICTSLPEFHQGSCQEIIKPPSNEEQSGEVVLQLLVDFSLETHAVKGYMVFLLDVSSMNEMTRYVDMLIEKAYA